MSAFSPFRLPTLQGSPRSPQDRSKMAQETSQVSPGDSQDGPKELQDAHEACQESSRGSQEGPKRRNPNFRSPEDAPRGPQEGLRGPRRDETYRHEAAEKPPMRPQEASLRGVLSTSQFGPMIAPRSHRNASCSSSPPPPPPPPPSSPPPSRSPRAHQHIVPMIQYGLAE